MYINLCFTNIYVVLLLLTAPMPIYRNQKSHHLTLENSCGSTTVTTVFMICSLSVTENKFLLIYSKSICVL